MPSNRDETRIYNKNKFKLGLFGMNCSGSFATTAPRTATDMPWRTMGSTQRYAVT